MSIMLVSSIHVLKGVNFAQIFKHGTISVISWELKISLSSQMQFQKSILGSISTTKQKLEKCLGVLEHQLSPSGLSELQWIVFSEDVNDAKSLDPLQFSLLWNSYDLRFPDLLHGILNLNDWSTK